MNKKQDAAILHRSQKSCLAFLLLICLQVSCTTIPADAAQPIPKPSKFKVVCFGDSITNRGYPQVLAQLTGVDAINAGVGGNSTAKALRRLDRDVLTQKPDVVVILFGTNDLRADADHAYVPVAKYKANLNFMIAKCRQQGARIVLCTLPPIEQDAFFTRHEREPFKALGGLSKLIGNYREAARQVAVDQKTLLVDLNQLLTKEPQWMSKDGVHPSEEGNAIIAKHVTKVVLPILANLKSPHAAARGSK